MKDFLVAFIVFLIWSVLGLWIFNSISVYNKTSRIPNQTSMPYKKVNATIKQPSSETTNNFNEKPIGKFIITTGNDFVKENNANDFKISTRIFLINNPDQVLTIYGLYQKREPYTIAERRARSLKSIFIKDGIDSSRIRTGSKEGSFTYNRNGEYNDGFIFEFKSTPAKTEKVTDNNTLNKVLFTKFASNTFNPDNSFGTYVDSLKAFLDQNTQKNISVTGHTDATGDETDNEWIGLQRAKSVADFLISEGIEESRIRIGSAGETEPISNNNTPEGRQKNRRIVITIN